MDENKISFSLGILKHFINDSLGLNYEDNKITGFELLNSIIDASAHNTYVETIGNKADTLYRRIKESPISMTTHAYLNYIKRLSAKLKLNEKEVVLESKPEIKKDRSDAKKADDDEFEISEDFLE